MKKNILVIMLMLSLAALSGCSSSAPSDAGSNSGQDVTTNRDDYIDQALKEKLNQSEDQTDEASQSDTDSDTANASGDDGVDMDLTELGDSMVYAQVYELLSNADKYMGQTIKVKGKFQSTVSEDTNNRYYYVTISDITACCQQGFEFIWGDGSHVYPDEYPQENSDIVITGVLSTYDEGDKTYCYLAVDDLNV